MHFLTEVKWRLSKACKGSRNFLEQLDFIFIWLNNTEHLAELFFTFIVSVYWKVQDATKNHTFG